MKKNRLQVTGDRLQKIRAFFGFALQPVTCNLQASQKGFTLLLAALVASIVLTIGAAIFSIALKQLELASTGKNSQFAFYAADTGAECALYWDVRHLAFATSSTSVVPGAVTCNESVNISAPVIDHSATAATTTFQYDFVSRDISNQPRNNCVIVLVAKYLSSVTGGIATRIHADGYSTACVAIETDTRALQRSVELRY